MRIVIIIYSWDVGHVHFVIFSTEVYFFTEYGSKELVEYQYNWLELDLMVRTYSKMSFTGSQKP